MAGSQSTAAPLSGKQWLLLQGVLPIVIVGVALPVGLVALFLAVKGASASGAIKHGELYLSGGNAAFTGCVALFSGRRGDRASVAIATLYVLMVVVVPCYATWAFFATQTALGETYSGTLATDGGAVSALAGSIVALTLIKLSQPGSEPGAIGQR